MDIAYYIQGQGLNPEYSTYSS